MKGTMAKLALALLLAAGAAAMEAETAQAHMTDNNKSRLCSGDDYVKHWNAETRVYHKGYFRFWDAPWLNYLYTIEGSLPGNIFEERRVVNCTKH